MEARKSSARKKKKLSAPAVKSLAKVAIAKQATEKVPTSPISCLRRSSLARSGRKQNICWSPKVVTKEEYTYSPSQYDRSMPTQPKIYCCDYCGQYFRGLRYHCTLCEDFDICKRCWNSTEPRIRKFCKHSRSKYIQETEDGDDDDDNGDS